MSLLSALFFAILSLQIGFSLTGKNEVKQSNDFDLATLETLQSKSRNGIIEFNSNLLKKFSLIDHQKRNYHLFVIFNALDKETNCEFCGVAAEIFKGNAYLFNKKAKKGKLPSFFASIELKNNMEAFQMMGLDQVPVIMHFGPEKRQPTKFENLNPNEQGALLNFMATQSGSQLNLQDAMKPEPNHNVLIFFATIAAVLAALIYSGALSASSVFKNTIIWSISIISFIIVMLSGYMWTKIRNPPYYGRGQGGEIKYFSNSPQMQLGVESRIVTGLNGAIVLVFLLITAVTYKFEGNNKRRTAAMVMSLLYMAAHAGLLKIFAQKFPGYPLSYIF